MKHLIPTFLFFLIIALSFNSCKDKEAVVASNPVVPKAILSASPDSLKFTESADSSTLTIAMN